MTKLIHYHGGITLLHWRSPRVVSFNVVSIFEDLVKGALSFQIKHDLVVVLWNHLIKNYIANMIEILRKKWS